MSGPIKIKTAESPQHRERASEPAAVKNITRERLDVNPGWQTFNTEPILIKRKAAVREQIFNLVSTVIGTEQFEPSFGSGLPNRVFELANSNGIGGARMTSLLKEDIIDAVTQFMGGSVVVDHGESRVIPDYGNEAFVITLEYYIIDAKVTDSYEFSVKP